MGRKRRYRRFFSAKKLRAIQRRQDEMFENFSRRLEEEVNRYLDALERLGPERFILMFVLAPKWEAAGREFVPDPRFYAELREKLAQVRNEAGAVEGLRVSRVGRVWEEAPRLRIELPLDANLKEYLPVIQAYQEYFQSLEGPNPLVVYLVDEHGRGRTYAELADELNEAIIAWAKGETPRLFRDLRLDAFLRKVKGWTPEDYELYDEERVRRLVKHYWTRK